MATSQLFIFSLGTGFGLLLEKAGFSTRVYLLTIVVLKGFKEHYNNFSLDLRFSFAFFQDNNKPIQSNFNISQCVLDLEGINTIGSTLHKMINNLMATYGIKIRFIWCRS